LELKRRHIKPIVVYSSELDILTERYICAAISFLPYGSIVRQWSSFRNQPLVCINDIGYEIGGVYSVLSDEAGAIRKILSALKQGGHRKVAMFFSSRITLSTKKRTDYFEALAPAYGIEPLLCDLDLSMKIPRDYRSQVLAMPDDCTAAICAGETFYPNLGRALAELRPGMQRVIWENLFGVPFAEDSNSLILAQDFRKLARESVSLLERLLQGETSWNEITVPYIFYF
jgi:DNA-binding LacI/PurR family transcriptional regulator